MISFSDQTKSLKKNECYGEDSLMQLQLVINVKGKIIKEVHLIFAQKNPGIPLMLLHCLLTIVKIRVVSDVIETLNRNACKAYYH